MQDNSHWLVETKGREDSNVTNKDAAAQNWCEKANTLTDTNWQYLKVLQYDWVKMQAEDFEDLLY